MPEAKLRAAIVRSVGSGAAWQQSLHQKYAGRERESKGREGEERGEKGKIGRRGRGTDMLNCYGCETPPCLGTVKKV